MQERALMAGGENLGDGYIEIGAEDDTGPGVDAIQKNLVKELMKAGKVAGKAMGEQLARAMDKAGDEMVRELRVDLEDIKDLLRDLGRQVYEPEIRPDVDAKEAQSRLAVLARDRVVNLIAVVRGNAAAELALLAKGLSGISMITSINRAFLDFGANLPMITGRAAALGGTLATIITPLLNLLTILAPLGANLVQISGILAALPAFGLAAGASIGVLISAFVGLDEATSASARQFKAAFDGMKEDFSALQDVIQSNFFDGFAAPFERVVNVLMPQLESGLSALAGSLGRQWGAVSDALAEAFSANRLDTFFQNLTAGVDAATPGIAGIASGLATIATKGSFLFESFGKWIADIGTQFQAWAESADIVGIIQNAVEQGGFLLDVFRELGGIVGGVFRAISAGGNSTGLESMAATLGKIHDIVDSPAFQTGLTTIFQGVSEGASLLADALVPIGNSLAALAPTISTLFSSLSGGAAEALKGIAAAFAAPVAQDGLNAAIEGLAGVLSGIDWSGFSAVIGALGGAIGMAGPLVVSILNAIIPLLAPLAEGFAGVIGVLTGAPGALASVSEGFSSFFSGLIATAGPAIEGLIEAAGKLIPALAGAILGALPQLVSALGGIISTLLSTLGSVLSQLLPMIAQAIPQIIAAVVSAVPDMLAGAIELFMGLVEGLYTAIPLLITGLLQVLPQLVGTLLSMVPMLLTAALQLFQSIVQGLLTAIPMILSTLLGMLPQLLSTILGMLPSILQAALQVFIGIVTAVLQAIPQIIMALVQLLPQLVMTLVSMIPDLLATAIELFVMIVEAVVTAIPQIITALVELLPQLVTTLVDMIPTLFQTALDLFLKIVTAVVEAIPRIITALIGMLPRIISTLIGMIPQLLQAAIQLFKALVEAIPRVLPQLINSLIQMGPQIVSAIISLVPALIGAGVDLINGLVQGIMSAAGSVGDALLGIAQDAVGNFLDFLGINSPSKLFMGFGKNIGQGLVNGITAMAKPVSDSLGDLVPNDPLAVGVRGFGSSAPKMGRPGNEWGSTTNTTTNTRTVEAGAIVVQGSTDPAKTAQEVVDRLAEEANI